MLDICHLKTKLDRGKETTMSYYSEQLHGYGVDIEELELPDKMR